MTLWETLVTQNPMMIEITRFRRKYFSPRGGSMNSVILALFFVIYLGLVAMVWNFREEANPMIIVFLQTGIFTLLPPAMLHGSIAGERERRSWDFLLVAPVSHAQIVAGKFAGAVVALLISAAFFLFPIAIGVLFYQPYYGSSPSSTTASRSLFSLLEGELLSVTWGIFVCALTIFFSARCRRGFIALGAALGFLIGGLIVWPVLIGTAGGGGGYEIHLLNFFHPFWALAEMEFGRPTDAQSSFSWMFGWPQIFVYIVLSAVMLGWAERTLRFADNEVKFLPKPKDA